MVSMDVLSRWSSNLGTQSIPGMKEGWNGQAGCWWTPTGTLRNKAELRPGSEYTGLPRRNVEQEAKSAQLDPRGHLFKDAEREKTQDRNKGRET